MDAVTKIWNLVVQIWDWLDGHKTDIGLKLGGIALAIMSAQNFFDFHPSWLTPIIEWIAKFSTWLTGIGLGDKTRKMVAGKIAAARTVEAPAVEK